MSDIETKQPAELPEAEKARDEKCIPVARWILNDMALMLLPENGEADFDMSPLLLKMLSRMTEADMNIAMEVSYVPQLILGVLSGLNAAVQECDVVKMDDARYGKIGKKILSIVATADIRMNAVTPEQTKEDFKPVKQQLNELFAAEKISLVELKYIMDSIFKSFTAANNAVQSSLESSSARAEAKLFGIESMSDLTLKQLDTVLKS